VTWAIARDSRQQYAAESYLPDRQFEIFRSLFSGGKQNQAFVVTVLKQFSAQALVPGPTAGAIQAVAESEKGKSALSGYRSELSRHLQDVHLDRDGRAAYELALANLEEVAAGKTAVPAALSWAQKAESHASSYLLAASICDWIARRLEDQGDDAGAQKLVANLTERFSSDPADSQLLDLSTQLTLRAQWLHDRNVRKAQAKVAMLSGQVRAVQDALQAAKVKGDSSGDIHSLEVALSISKQQCADAQKALASESSPEVQ